MCIFSKLFSCKTDIENAVCDSISENTDDKVKEYIVDGPIISNTSITYKQYNNVIVCLDNGHAKSTAGKRSPYAGYKTLPELPLYEYETNRIIVRKIAEKLKLYGIEPFIVTPEIDKDVALTTRYKRANNKKLENPDKLCLFISVHSDAYGDGKTWNSGNGWSCYTTVGQNNSDKLAECLYDAAKEVLPIYNKKIRTDLKDGDSDYEENFTVIYGANMPAVLTENLFFTNIADTEFLLSDIGQEVISDIHVNGILKYLEKY